MIIVSKYQLNKIRTIKEELPSLETIIVLDNIDMPGDNEILFSDIIKNGTKLLADKPGILEERWKSVTGDDYANICYTSGTTADPKGIILTHKNYTVNIRQSLSLFSVPEWWTTLLILPWDHE